MNNQNQLPNPRDHQFHHHTNRNRSVSYTAASAPRQIEQRDNGNRTQRDDDDLHFSYPFKVDNYSEQQSLIIRIMYAGVKEQYQTVKTQCIQAQQQSFEDLTMSQMDNQESILEEGSIYSDEDISI